MNRSEYGEICQCVMSFVFVLSMGVTLREYPKICRRSMTSGTLPVQTKRKMVKIMQNISEHGQDAKSGLTDFKRLEALDILSLPICLRNGNAVDAEHATDYEFTSWLKWNGVPFTGLATWTFDNRCAVVNYALQHGVKIRLVSVPIERSLGTVSEMFVFPQLAPEDDGNDMPPDGVA